MKIKILKDIYIVFIGLKTAFLFYLLYKNVYIILYASLLFLLETVLSFLILKEKIKIIFKKLSLRENTKYFLYFIIMSIEVVSVSPEKKEKKEKITRSVLNEFQEKHRKIYVLTTRYNEKTLLANRTFLEKSGKYKCVYSSPSEISEKIPVGSKCIVLEMNNDTNRIIGIGLIEKTECKKKLCVQEWGYYNRVHYAGYFRINREDLILDSLAVNSTNLAVNSTNLAVNSTNLKESQIMELLDSLCFKGSGHLKRGKGLTMFPVSYLYSHFERGINIEFELREMFNRRFSESSSSSLKKKE